MARHQGERNETKVHSITVKQHLEQDFVTYCLNVPCEIGGTIGAACVRVGLAGCNGILRLTVVEQDILTDACRMRALRARLDVDDGGDVEKNRSCVR